jgi:hypothetical protein
VVFLDSIISLLNEQKDFTYIIEQLNYLILFGDTLTVETLTKGEKDSVLEKLENIKVRFKVLQYPTDTIDSIFG